MPRRFDVDNIFDQFHAEAKTHPDENQFCNDKVFLLAQIQNLQIKLKRANERYSQLQAK